MLESPGGGTTASRWNNRGLMQRANYKHEPLNHCWCDAEPASQTMNQHRTKRWLGLLSGVAGIFTFRQNVGSIGPSVSNAGPAALDEFCTNVACRRLRAIEPLWVRGELGVEPHTCGVLTCRGHSVQHVQRILIHRQSQSKSMIYYIWTFLMEME